MGGNFGIKPVLDRFVNEGDRGWLEPSHGPDGFAQRRKGAKTEGTGTEAGGEAPREIGKPQREAFRDESGDHPVLECRVYEAMLLAGEDFAWNAETKWVGKNGEIVLDGWCQRHRAPQLASGMP